MRRTHRTNPRCTLSCLASTCQKTTGMGCWNVSTNNGRVWDSFSISFLRLSSTATHVRAVHCSAVFKFTLLYGPHADYLKNESSDVNQNLLFLSVTKPSRALGLLCAPEFGSPVSVPRLLSLHATGFFHCSAFWEVSPLSPSYRQPSCLQHFLKMSPAQDLYFFFPLAAH